MGSTDDYLEQLAAEADRIRREQGLTPPQPEAEKVAPPVEDEHQVYYSPGQKLEGRDEFVDLPEDWENEGSRFEVSRGKHEAIIEGVFSSELDGGEDHREIIHSGSKKKYLVAGLIAAAVLAVPAIAILTGDDAPADNTPTAQTPPQDPIGNFAVAFEKPLEKALPKAATPPSNNVIVSSSGRYLISSSGEKFSVANLPVRASAEGCEVTLPTEFCLAGTVEAESGKLPVYYGKNVVTLPTLSEAAEFEEFKKKGTALSAQTVVFFAGEPTRFLVFVLPNSSGWFMAVPSDLSADELEKLKASVKVGN